jgi:hypothetical protein
LLRGLAIELIRKTSPKNFQAAIDNFVDSAHALESMLLQVKFLGCGSFPPNCPSYHAANLRSSFCGTEA